MGSQNEVQEELTVLVTGFGPFMEQHPINPSWEIASGLPSHLPALQAKDPRSREAIETPPVRILAPPEPIRTSYKAARNLVPTFWDTYQGHKVDIAIRIGMNTPQPFYQIERLAHRRGYCHSDVDDELLEDGEEGKPDNKDWIWYDLPDEIHSGLDIDDVHKRWQGNSLKDMDLRISDDAGHFLCDFVYYSSLAHLQKANRPRKVVFLHVPANSTDAFISQGRELTMNLIRAIVESEAARNTGESTSQEA